MFEINNELAENVSSTTLVDKQLVSLRASSHPVLLSYPKTKLKPGALLKSRSRTIKPLTPGPLS